MAAISKNEIVEITTKNGGKWEVHNKAGKLLASGTAAKPYDAAKAWCDKNRAK